MVTLEDVYSWLYKFEPGHISLSSGHLVEQMKSGLESGDKDTTWETLKKLVKSIGQLREEEEVIEILVECAHTACLLGDFDEAEIILKDAHTRAWSYPSKRALIQWMLGCVQWRTPEKRDQAVNSWCDGFSDFQRLSRRPGQPREQQAWYRETSTRLESSLEEALALIDRQPAITEPAAKPPPSVLEQYKQVPGKPPPAVSLHALTSDLLQLFTISEEIPAGDFGPSGVDPFPIGTVEVDRLSINGRPFRVHSTRGRKIINLPPDQRLSVVRVKGDSMDLENIKPGDYVLFRRTEAAENGDIVLAEIIGSDTRASVKRYSYTGDTVILQPNSSNPEHKPFVFRKPGEGFHIRGIVIAVLKPE